MQAGEVETPAMAAEARRETRLGAEGDEEGDGGDGAQDSERVRIGLSITQHIILQVTSNAHSKILVR